MYSYLFGPVPSRRLGMSLGIDLIPKKVCSLNCVYCEVGETSKLTLDRKAYVPVQKIFDELEHFFLHHPDPDFITFSGSGEPTLHSQIGEVIAYIKHSKPDIPIAVLTNGTLLYDETVRKELLLADVVLPSLDAASNTAFQRINRPAPELDLSLYIQGLIDFRNEFKGKVWLEVFILPGYNDSSENIERLKQAIIAIAPDEVQLNTLDRPGTVSDLSPASVSQLQAVAKALNFPNTIIISANSQRRKIESYRQDKETAILETIARRPCTLDDLSTILALHPNELNKYLSQLESENKVKSVSQKRGIFYKLS